MASANLQEARLAGSEMTDMIREEYEDAGKEDADIPRFRDADLTDADLTGANLRGASVTARQLAECASLRGATMPDGTVHD